MKSKALASLIICYIVILITHFGYYPKWQQDRTEATLSWDVSGYYMYLPALFIYDDLKGCSFKDDILNEYYPTPDFQQAFMHSSGNYVMKYSMGQAVIFSPFFALGHLYASLSDQYSPDGFSRPYQFMISIGSLIIAFIGLYYLMKVLLGYFTDQVVAISLLILTLGTNYLNYSAIDGAMTHNLLFSLYAILVYLTDHFYKNPKTITATTVGLLIGLLALIRPTEIIACFIPILWGINFISIQNIKHRISFFKNQRNKIVAALIACLAVGSLQFIYWKYASGEWVVYSYQDQGFSWLRPHIWEGMFSYKSGWLTYTPIMAFALIGFYFLYKSKKSLFIPTIIFSILFIYIAFAWDIWWYGGSLGQRTMVQAYPILTFPLCAFISWVSSRSNIWKVTVGIITTAFVYINIWFTHQAHLGGMLYAGQMTKAYYWKTLGTYTKDINNLKLLDTNEDNREERKNLKVLLENKETITLDQSHQYSPEYTAAIASENQIKWIRARAHVTISQKEWDVWRMTQMIIKCSYRKEVLKTNFIRIHRLMNDGDEKVIHIDMKMPAEPIDAVHLLFWNADSQKSIEISDIIIESSN